jgi:peptidase M50-like protein
MSMTNIEPPAADPPNEVLYRCIQCGIESKEATCFAAIATNGTFAGTCITCNQPLQHIRQTQIIIGIFALVFLPVIFLVAIRGIGGASFVELIIAASLLQPFLVILHELGHALTARIVGLEVALLTLGTGKNWGSGKLLNVPFRLCGWPLSGFTYLVTTATRRLRLRLWITTLMGPVTNMILIAAAVMFWNPLAQALDSNILVLWILYNSILVVSSLLPRQSRHFGHLVRSDGMQLMRIPFQTEAQMATSFGNTYAGIAFVLYNDADYSSALDVCLKGFQRLPGSPQLNIMLSACRIDMGDYESGRAIIEPLLDSAHTLSPEIRAALENNLALALWLRDFNSASQDLSTLRGDALSDHAYGMYPCVLAYRSTRAVLLAATHRAEDALALLEYMNYERGSPEERGNREIARAFALRQLDRSTEAQQALNIGLQLCKKRLPWLTTIGLLPVASETRELRDA